MLKIGLTGGIGSGKSTVADKFKALGAGIIDTDVIAHELVNNDRDVLQQIRDSFGEDVIQQDGRLDRKHLASIVFNNSEKKQRLEAILHPRIRLEVDRRLQSLNRESERESIEPQSSRIPYCIVVVPLLLETDFRDLVDRILVVLADEAVRIERIKNRDNRTLDDIQSIMSNQANDEQRINAADDIINNNNDIRELDRAIRILHASYCRLQSHAE